MVAHRMQPPSKRLNARCSSRSSPGTNGKPEQLSVGMGDRGAGLATVIDDRLRVAHVWRGRVLEEAALEHEHHLGGIGVADGVDAGVVVAGQHEHLVGAAGLGLDVHRATVMDGERLVAVEGRVQVGDHAHAPRAALVDGLERGQRHLLVARAERARPIRVGFDLDDAGREIGRTLRTLGHDRDPPPGEWIQTQLTHSTLQLRTLRMPSGRTGL